ncbi:MAG TPA: peptidylprolyl isomerase [Clostridia bacterium]|nr:peptidylprolyl isomerase [Clostridia bacterium]
MRKLVFSIFTSAVILSCAGFASAATTDKTGQALAEGARIFLNNSQTDYVAMVGQEKITMSEYKFFLSNVKLSIEQAVGVGQENEESFWTGKLGSISAAEYAKEQALFKAQEFKMELIKAKESGVKLNADDEQEITDYINNVISIWNGKTAAEKIIKSTYGINLDELKTIYGESRLVDKFIAAEKGKIQPEGSQLEEYYNSSIEVPGKITTVQHILILAAAESEDDLYDKELAKKKQLAEDILAQVNSGTDFNTLVQKYSEDPGSKNTGGEYTFGKGEMVKEFEDWAFNAKPGDTGLIRTDYGFHIMRKPTFEEMQNVIKEKYLDQAYENMLSAWIKDKKYAVVKNNAVYAKITIFNVTTDAK